MSSWFTNYKGDDWDPSKGFNELFANLIRSIRSEFGLEKIKMGEERSSGQVWEMYEFGGKQYLVRIDLMTWTQFPKTTNNRYVCVLGFEVLLVTDLPNKPLEQIDYSSCKQVRFVCSLTIPPSFPLPLILPEWRVVEPKNYKDEQDLKSHGLVKNGIVDLPLSPSEKEQGVAVDKLIEKALHFLAWHYHQFGW